MRGKRHQWWSDKWNALTAIVVVWAIVAVVAWMAGFRVAT